MIAPVSIEWVAPLFPYPDGFFNVSHKSILLTVLDGFILQANKMICVLTCLRSDSWMYFTIGYIVLLHWMQINIYQKEPETVFNWNKRIKWAYSFVKKMRRLLTVFESIFLRNRSVTPTKKFCYHSILFKFLPACGPNTYQIMYRGTLDFQRQH